MNVSWTKRFAKVGAEEGAAGATSAEEAVGIAAGAVADAVVAGAATVEATEKKRLGSHGKAAGPHHWELTIHCPAANTWFYVCKQMFTHWLQSAATTRTRETARCFLRVTMHASERAS